MSTMQTIPAEVGFCITNERIPILIVPLNPGDNNKYLF